MSGKKSSKFGRLRSVLASFLVLIGILVSANGMIVQENAYAIGEDDETGEVITEEEIEGDDGDESESDEEEGEESNITDDKDAAEKSGNGCKDSLGALGWLVCPVMEKISGAVDWLYDKIEEILVINPVRAEDGSPIYEIWKYCLGLTNIVFIIFLLIVIYSQLTGLGISNYGIKKVLPKLIVTAVLVNLSFLICSLAVDVSNIVGNSLRGVFESVEESAVASSSSDMGSVSFGNVYSAMAGGTALALGGGAIAFETGMMWMLIPTVLGAIVAVVTGLITIALRQAVVVLLIMISPMAMVANILPNTEKWFTKWKDYLIKMLVFYPMFSLLFGASSLAGFAIIMSAQDGFWLMLGLAVQIFPLFFAWSLMKMSGTVLGTINSKLNGLVAAPLNANRAWADSHRQQSSLRALAYGRTPSSHLRRYIGNRRALREKHIEDLSNIAKGRANLYVQDKVSGGYNGKKANGTEAYLNPNKYTKAAKDASTMGLKSETATMDTAHALSNYGNYYVSKNVRDKIKAAEKAKNAELAESIKMGDSEARRNALAADAYLEYSRAAWTKEHDDESDRKFAAGTFIDVANDYKARPEIEALRDHELTDAQRRLKERYGHYIISTAGGLGATGETRVLGKVLSQAAAVESAQRRDVNIVAQKWPPDKISFRNMMTGYITNDDGYAIDKDGKVEEERGKWMKTNPERLVLWDKVDENGAYFDWYDTNGKYVTRVYKKDKATIKELLSNFDAPINDPINNLYGILAGVEEGSIGGGDEKYKHIGLEDFRTTIGRALMGAPFKEKNAAFSPLVKEMISKGYIKNSAQEYLAYLDSITKATKPGAWNQQDRDAVKMFAMIMNPNMWEEVFPLELLKEDTKNINGEELYGYRLDDAGKIMTDDAGNKIKVPLADATWPQLMARIKEKYISPALLKMPAMMKRMTPNIIENQKPEVASAWRDLYESVDRCGYELGINPYDRKESGDMEEIMKGMRQQYKIAKTGEGHVNHQAEVRSLRSMALDAEDFVSRFEDYSKNHSELAWVVGDFLDHVKTKRVEGLDISELYDYLSDLLVYVEYDG